MANQGRSAGEIVRYLETDGPESSIYIVVNTLELLKKSGRVTPAGAAIGTVLNIKPVLQIQGGKLDAFKKVRGMNAAMHAIIAGCNIREKSLLECLRSPLFMAYHNGQPFHENHLRPCPMLENPEKLRKIVEETGAHSTDMQSPESADHLCAKCDTYAANWADTADKLWECSCKNKAAKKQSSIGMEL